jgi:WD40 repeat protein
VPFRGFRSWHKLPIYRRTHSVKTIRIFISSPGDVQEEREKARQVIATLDRFYQARCRLQAVFWEDLPLGADNSFQEGIDCILSSQNRIDIAVFILWSRLGSPLREDIKRREGGAPYRSGTEREFDLMMQAREQGDGRPHILAYTREDAEGFGKILNRALQTEKMAGKADRIIEELMDQRKLVNTFIEENFQDDQGRNLRAHHTYDQPITFASRLKVHLRALLSDLLAEIPAATASWEGSPFRGLRTFDVSHAPIFFGREQEVSELELLMRRRAAAGRPFTAIVAPSGFGKSSLALAGVAASLVKENLDGDGTQWRLAVMQPADKGGDPLEALAEALAATGALEELRAAGDFSMQRFREALAVDATVTLKVKVEDTLDQAERKAGCPIRLLLVVDQCEELWTDTRISPEARNAFLVAMEALLSGGRVWVLATLRADVYPITMQEAAFRRLKQAPKNEGDCDGMYELGPPDPASVHRLIREPATLAGLRFETISDGSRTLDEELLRDAIGHADALPLLEYALEQLFEKRTTDGVLTLKAYKEIGGVEGAVGVRAAETYEKLPEEVKNALLEVLPLLLSVQISGEKAVTRRRATMAELEATPMRRELIKALIAARFLTTSEQKGVGYAMLAHEALLRRWDRLKLWLRDNREILEFREHVSLAAADWQRECEAGSGGEADLLLSTPLALLRGEKALEAGLLSTEEAKFVTISRAWVNAGTMRRRRRLQALAAAAAVMIVVLAGLTWHTTLKSREVRVLLAESDSDHAERLFGEEDSAAAVWYLARAVASRASSGRVSARLWYSLRERSWPMPAFDARDQGSPITVVAFDSGGERFVSATRDGQTTISSSRTGQPLGQPLKHPMKVDGALFSPDGTRLLTGCADAEARLWDLENPAFPLLASCHHQSVVAGIAWSKDGGFFATGSWDHHVRIWKSSDPQAPVFSAEMKEKIHTVAFSPKDSRLVLAVAGDEARIYDRATGTVAFSQTSIGDLNGACFSPDGAKLICFSNEGDLVISDLESGIQQWARLTFQTPCQLAEAAPDGKTFLVATGNHLQVYSMEQPPRSIWEHDFTDLVSHARFTPDSRRILAACDAGAIEVFNAAHGARLHEPISGRGVPIALDFHPVGNRILSAWSTREVRIHSLPPPAPLPRASFHLGAPPVAAAITENAVACLAENGHGLLIESESGQGQNFKTLPVEFRLPVTAAAFHPERALAVVGGIDGRVFAMELKKTGPPVALPKCAAAISTLAFSADGAWLAVGSEDGQVQRWPWPKLTSPAGGVSQHRDKVSGLAFLEPGARLLSAGWDDKLWLQPVGRGAPTAVQTEGEPLFARSAPSGKTVIVATSKGDVWLAKEGSDHLEKAFRLPHPASCAAVSSATGLVAMGTVNGEVTLWSLREGLKVADIYCGQDRVNSVAFDSTGSKLATGTEDGKARVWEVPSGQAVTETIQHQGAVRHVLLSEDGQNLVSIQIDGAILLWPLDAPISDSAMVKMASDCLRSDPQQARRFVQNSSILSSMNPAGLGRLIASLRASGNPEFVQEAEMLAAYLPTR